jgi:hypothetical protein
MTLSHTIARTTILFFLATFLRDTVFVVIIGILGCSYKLLTDLKVNRIHIERSVVVEHARKTKGMRHIFHMHVFIFHHVVHVIWDNHFIYYAINLKKVELRHGLSKGKDITCHGSSKEERDLQWSFSPRHHRKESNYVTGGHSLGRTPATIPTPRVKRVPYFARVSAMRSRAIHARLDNMQYE